MKYTFLILLILLIPSFAGIADGHTIDAVGEYRVEIGWMNEPVVSGETNALELYISPLVDCPDISISMECAFVSPDTTGSFIQPISTRYSPTASIVCPSAIPAKLGISNIKSIKKVYFIIKK
jgi:hypothetical protein